MRGAAPAALAGPAAPDAIFVGGGIGDPALLRGAVARAAARRAARRQRRHASRARRALLDWQARHGGELTRIAVSRAEPLGGHHGWRPLLPVTQLAAGEAAADMRGMIERLELPAGGPMRCCRCCASLLYLPGIAAIPPLDRDEARFAQATRQMLETGDFLRIRFQDEARNKKPAGIYWLQAASVAAFSDAGEHRDLALSPAVAARRRRAAVLLTFALRRARSSGAAGGACIGAALLAVRARRRRRGASRQDRRGAARGGRRGAGRARPRLSARAPAAAIGAMALGAAVLGGARRRRSCSRGRSAPLVGAAHRRCAVDRRPRRALAARPAAALGRAAHAGDRCAVVHRDQRRHRRRLPRRGARPRSPRQADRRAGSARRAARLLPAAARRRRFWPGSLLLGAGAGLGLARARAMPAERFLLAWLVPFWILLELVPTKLPHYRAAGLSGAGAARRPRRAGAGDGALPACGAGATASRSRCGRSCRSALAVALILLPIRFGAGFDAVGVVAAA